MFVALGSQHAMCMLHVVICGLPRIVISPPHILIYGTIFEKDIIELKSCES